ncbi:MAG: S9 family peptidase [Bacteroidota bacterium]
MKKNGLLTLLLLLGVGILIAQPAKEITLEAIWQDYLFYPRFVPGFNFQNDGKHYTRKGQQQIKQYDILSGKETEVLFDASTIEGVEGFDGTFDSYAFSDDEQKLMIKTQTEGIYRRSTKANFFVYDRKAAEMKALSSDGKQSYASFSADASKVAYVRENNLFYHDLASGKTIQVTEDGQYNSIINGSADWVYEEEFSFAKAFQWSPDGQKIAFMRFDESRVKEFTMTLYNDDAYPEYETFKYPKVGEDNAVLSIHIYDLASGKTVRVDTGAETDIYFPRIKWSKDPNKLCVFRMNRHQSHLELLMADATTGKVRLLLEEKNEYYIDITDDLTFLDDGKHFIWTSEKSGFNHLYMYSMSGKMVRQLTKGDYDVTRFYGVDEEKERIYYQAAEASALERGVYSVNFKGKDKKNLASANGSSSAQFSRTFDYYVVTHSTANRAATYTVYNRSGKELRVIEDNAEMAELQQTYGVQNVEFMKIPTSDEVELNAYMIKPPNFDASKKYPVFMYVYGGPGSQTVTDSYGGLNYWWFQMLAQKGYIVVSVDNRGTGARGEKFKKMTYLQLGKYETIDQIEAARYLAGLSYTDAGRIGIFGWSYGGYMSSLCILKGSDVFKAAIAVAPVTNWKWYDTIYTERYMRTDEENPDGYKDNSPVYFADRLKGSYLLVHGNADDNVHFQNTVEMANALIAANKQFDTYFYPNRNHGIFGGSTRLHLYTKMTDFLLENL